MKNYIKGLVFISSLLIGLLVLIPNLVSASTTISAGTISENTYWTADQGPYLVTQSLYVPENVILNIAPGTIVKFYPDTSLTIDGSLESVGTYENKITLTSIKDDSVGESTSQGAMPTFKDWVGINFNNNRIEQNLKNVNIRYASQPINAKNVLSGNIQNIIIASSGGGASFYQSNFTIKDLILRDLKGTALNIYSSSTVKVSSTTISNIVDNPAVAVYEHSSLDMDNSVITDVRNSIALNIFNQSRVNIDRSVIRNIQTDFNDNAIDFFNDSSLSIKNSLIENIIGNAFLIFENNSADSGLALINTTIASGTENAIWSFDQSSITISSSTIKNFKNAALKKNSSGHILIQNSVLENNGTGLDLKGGDLEIATSSIKNNKIYGLLNRSSAPIIGQNVWWGVPSGPYNQNANASGTANAVSDNVSFSPWLSADPFLTTPITTVATSGSNIIFLPGIEGSRLYTRGILSENQLWEPNRNDDVNKLNLDTTGISLDPTIYTRDVIGRTNLTGGLFDKNIYQSFLKRMDQLVSAGAINAWEAIPYDWRKDLDDLVINGIKTDAATIYLEAEVERMASTSKTGKVTIITHSNGGLLAKTLINHLQNKGKASLIDKLIMVAIPELGTPEAIGSLLHGDDQELKKFGYHLMSSPVARKFAENMPAAYTLLPNNEYFRHTSDPVIQFDPSIDKVNNFRKVYGDSLNSYEKLQAFGLAALDKRTKPLLYNIATPNVLNGALFERASTTHNKLDSLSLLSKLKPIEILGIGIPTSKSLHYFGKEKCLLDLICIQSLDHVSDKSMVGDGTVLTASAPLDQYEKYYLDLNATNEENNENLSHANILENQNILDFLTKLITSKGNVPMHILKDSFLSNISRLNIGVHSPVSLDVYDKNGKHTGLLTNPDKNSDMPIIEEAISNSHYEEEGEGKYVNLNEGSFKVRLSGTGLGSFTLNIDKFQNEMKSSSTIYTDIPVTPLTVAELDLGGTNSPSLLVDIDGDGSIDKIIKSNEGLAPIDYLTLLKKIIISLKLDNGKETSLNKRIDNIIKSLNTSKTGKLVAIQKLKAFGQSLAEKDKNLNKSHSFTSDEIAMFLGILNTLLNTLEGHA